jgi:hypothetical protein
MPLPSDGLDPYAPPRSDTVSPDRPLVVTDLTREQVHSFVGRRSGYYWDRWSRAELGRKFAGFNWAAAFFNLTWLLYRRMYREFGIGLGAMAVLGLAEAFLEPMIGKDNSATLSRIDNLVPVVALGILGNWLYLRRARDAIARTRHLATPAERHAFLAARGGTSWLAVLVGVGASVALVAAATMIDRVLSDR